MSYHPVSNEEKTSRAVELAIEASSVKTIVFVHSKITGSEIAKRLKMRGVRCAFHNASIPLGKRKKIEEAFNNRMSGLNVMVSTSTLSAGVNMAI
jgi:superfamily II helicase